MEIKIKKLKRGDESFILDVDCGEFHYRNVSKDEKFIDGLFEAANIIKLGLENSHNI